MSLSQDSTEIRGVLLPLQEGELLLPNAAVCEVVSYQAPDAVSARAPAWLLGAFAWRNHALPLIAFERLLGQESGEIGHRARVAIVNTLNGNDRLPYIGILLRAAPHLVRVTESSIVPFAGDEPPPGMVADRVIINGVDALIPDLDALESALSEFDLWIAADRLRRSDATHQ
ncbi:chemotaxis protein CheW [Sedimenticola hydrogenitrophicus]|uniref:chemotaxis protein CheW n=1 Tax=Sedimenticola hydrogenitrophicus TaxID=2967975 RepID=UPI0021A6A9B1|nr:chemotaxis protein CheW [Sedimenticola hydrogenitrophicus]